MLGTYASLAIVLAASAVAGQALFALCGRREWSWLSPAIGLALLCALCWGAVNLAGEERAGLGVLAGVTVVGLLALRRGGLDPADDDPPDAARVGVAVALGAVVLASLPFLVEQRFGILGTSLNPDMSQHLFAADQIADGGQERLASEGYPLGPHAVAASVAQLGPSLVGAFNGLTIAIAVAASLAPLALLGDLRPSRRATIALLAGFAYLAASYLIQGAFKETMQALFVLAFALGLLDLARGRLGGAVPAYRWRRLQAVPLAALAVGSVYVYSFPGLAWIAGALGVWLAAEFVLAPRRERFRRALAPAAFALVATGAAVAPELGRVAQFVSFETFDPDGPGLGNLFNPISPLEALGIWPSGDFRLDAGAGFAPSVAFWLGGLVAVAALGYGLRWWLGRGERAVPAALAAAVVLYLYALVGGTPYQEAKALAIAAPLAALISARALLTGMPPVHRLRRASPRALAMPGLTAIFLAGAAACSGLALVNGPVGPASWSPALTEFNEQIAEDEVVLAIGADELIADEHGFDLIAWELRGQAVCVVSAGEAAAGAVTDQAYDAVVVVGELGGPLPVVGRLSELAREGEYALYRSELSGAEPDCEFIADGDRAEPGAG